MTGGFVVQGAIIGKNRFFTKTTLAVQELLAV